MSCAASNFFLHGDSVSRLWLTNIQQMLLPHYLWSRERERERERRNDRGIEREKGKERKGKSEAEREGELLGREIDPSKQ